MNRVGSGVWAGTEPKTRVLSPLDQTSNHRYDANVNQTCANIFGGKCAVNIHALRRVLTTFVALAAFLTLLLVGSAAANAAPYPPANNCTTGAAPTTGGSLAVGGQSGQSGDGCKRGTNDRRENRTPNNNRNETQTANTGFATLTASLIAAALLVGGGALVVAGRRRSHG